MTETEVDSIVKEDDDVTRSVEPKDVIQHLGTKLTIKDE